MSPLPSDIEQALQKFGLSDFRPGQREVIESIVSGSDCMCIMPTGGGKSLCYQLPSIIRSGLTIVVSPLIALMKDQVDSLSARGISAALINSSLSASEQASRLQAVASGHYQLVYVAPERLRNQRFLEAIRATPIQLLAVDEAHCISQWGHDFRPDYTRIGKFRELLGGVQTVALTATATPKVRQDIIDVLHIKRAKQFMSGFARPNLHFGVVTSNNDKEKEQEVVQFLDREPGSGIIYCATRKRCEALVELLSKKSKASVGAYHGGLMPDQRKAIQDRFMKGDLEIVVATNAFGMGIDKSDLRFVLHYNMPGSLEAYYQEAGRAGRDGKQSQCVMLYSFQDRHIQEFFIENSYPERQLIQQVYEFLLARDEDPIELTQEEIRDRLGVQVSPEAIGSCLQILARTQVIDRLEMGGGLAMVRIDSNLPTLVDLLPREAKVRRQVMRFIENAIGDRRGEEVFLHPRWMLQESGLQRDTLTRALRELNKLSGFDYVPPFRGRAVHFRRRDLGFSDLQIDFANLKKRKEAEYDRLNQVVKYAQTPLCRQTAILKYFGDAETDDCTRCDRCGLRPGWPKFDVPQSERSPTKSKSGDAADGQSGALALTSVPGVQTAGQMKPKIEVDPAIRSAIEQIVDAIQRIHGRLGKLLISQYLSGSQNAKVQKLNLHRLSGFGLLKGFKQADVVQVLDALLAAGLLRQKEVNRNRPTVEVASEWMDLGHRTKLVAMVQLPGPLTLRLKAIGGGASPAEANRSNSQPVAKQAAKSAQAEPRASKPAESLWSSSEPGAEQRRVDKAPAPRPDWQWTLWLFSEGKTWNEVMEIRQMSDEEVSASLISALKAGGKVIRSWFSACESGSLSRGQQRIVRELQRRSAAGIR